MAILTSQISAIWAKFRTFVLQVVETGFWCLFQVFWHDKLLGTILRHLRGQMAILANQNKIAKGPVTSPAWPACGGPCSLPRALLMDQWPRQCSFMTQRR